MKLACLPVGSILVCVGLLVGTRLKTGRQYSVGIRKLLKAGI